MSNLILRIITALVLVPIVSFAFIMGDIYLTCLLALISLIACLEVAHIVDHKNTPSLVMAFIFWASIFTPSLSAYKFSFLAGLVPLFFIFNGYVLFNLSIDREKFLKLCAIFSWSVYINLGFLSAYWLCTSSVLPAQTGLALVLAACTTTFANDTCAYFCGRAFGKHPLFPQVSQKKTWEGFFGGGLGALVLIFVIFHLGRSAGLTLFATLVTVDLLWIALPALVLAPCGDLIESRFKRFYDVKDSSKILPGHGGLLDRIDALLMVMPWTALYAFIIRQL